MSSSSTPGDTASTPSEHAISSPSVIPSGSTSARLQDDCFRPGQQRLRHDEAIALLRSRLAPLTGVEPVALASASGRTLASPISASHPIPAHTNAAVDGYAFAASPDIRANGADFAAFGRAAAGHPLGQSCPRGAAVRIFTGAVLPAGTDTVVMQEDVEVGPASAAAGDQALRVRVPAGLKPGANVRKAGEDVAAGALLFEAGHILRPQDLAALASAGIASVACRARVRVAIVSTGDEVIVPGTGPLAPGQVYDANAPMLSGLVALAGAHGSALGIWPDRLETVTANLSAAASQFDVIVTSGGASLGDEDHMAKAISALGQRHLWQLAIKPGRPMMFGQIRSGDRDVIVIGLPGNPVAVFVCFLMYVLPMLRVLGGSPWREPQRFAIPAAFSFSGRKTGRREFWRGMLVEREGLMMADKFARDGSGLISGLRAADGLIDIPEDHGDVAEGDLVSFIPFAEFGIV